MRGRKPIPPEILELNKGKLYDIQAKRAENTPKPKKSLKPICPRTFTSEQRKTWNKYAKILKNYNLFTVANQTILEILSVNKTIYDFHREKLNGNDVLMDNPQKGFDIYENSFKVMQKTETVIFKCLSELGLSSAGLAKIGSLAAGAIKKQSKLEGLLD